MKHHHTEAALLKRWTMDGAAGLCVFIGKPGAAAVATDERSACIPIGDRLARCIIARHGLTAQSYASNGQTYA